MNPAPTFRDVLRARHVLRDHLAPTPLVRHPLLSTRMGFHAYVKHENHLPIGAFKVRGGLALFAQMGEHERARGVVTATRGNHGLSLAYAARRHGSRVVAYVPHGNSDAKNALLDAHGAERVEHGHDFEEAVEEARAHARNEGMRFVHPGNESQMIAGYATLAVEVAEQLPDLDAILVPMGSGACAAGVSLAIKTVLPQAKVIGVQAERAPALALSLERGRLIESETADTFAGGLAARRPGELAFEMLKGRVDQVVLASEQEMREGVREALQTTHNLAEGAAAAAYAAAKKLRGELSGKRVVLVHTGQNIRQETLRWALGLFDA